MRFYQHSAFLRHKAICAVPNATVL